METPYQHRSKKIFLCKNTTATIIAKGWIIWKPALKLVLKGECYYSCGHYRIHTNEAAKKHFYVASENDTKQLKNLKLWTKRNHDVERSAIHNGFDEQNTVTLYALQFHFIFVKWANLREEWKQYENEVSHDYRSYERNLSNLNPWLRDTAIPHWYRDLAPVSRGHEFKPRWSPDFYRLLHAIA